MAVGTASLSLCVLRYMSAVGVDCCERGGRFYLRVAAGLTLGRGLPQANSQRESERKRAIYTLSLMLKPSET